VKPWELLGEAQTPDGETQALMRQDDEVVILASGRPLMSSRMHGSKEVLASLSCGHLARTDAPVVLVGGLGMGFTLRAALPRSATIVVAELIPAVVDWNRGPIAELARHPLKDRRVRVAVNDVLVTLHDSARRFDAVLLDLDNGPHAFSTSGNAALYRDEGLVAIRSALKPAGVLAVWSARDERKFEQRLRYHGFAVEVHRVEGD